MNTRTKLATAVAVTSALAVTGSVALAGGGGGEGGAKGWLSGYQEVPAVSTAANGQFQATLTPERDGLTYKLSYTALEGNVTQAHIHFGQPAVAGAISVFLCSNLGNGPAGTQACPPGPATVEGTIKAADVIGPAAQGIAAGEFEELLRAMRSGMTYANVHSTKFPGGEIRAQLRAGWHKGWSKGHDRGGEDDDHGSGDAKNQ